MINNASRETKRFYRSMLARGLFERSGRCYFDATGILGPQRRDLHGAVETGISTLADDSDG